MRSDDRQRICYLSFHDILDPFIRPGSKRKHLILGIDYAGPYQADISGEWKYALTMVDMQSLYSLIWPSRRRGGSELIKALEAMELATSMAIGAVWPDMAAEFLSMDFRRFLMSKNIHLLRSRPYRKCHGTTEAKLLSLQTTAKLNLVCR